MPAQKYLILSSPEQLFHTKRDFSGFSPVIPLSFDDDTVATQLAYLKRKDIPTALIAESSESALTTPFVSDEMWLFSAHTALKLRKNEYRGALRLFCGVRDLIATDFFLANNITPVVTGEASVTRCQKMEIDFIYLSTDKSCIASFDRCLSNMGKTQNFLNCDNRCRIKSDDVHSPGFPLSIKPERYYPESSKAIAFYSDELTPKPPKAGAIISSQLEQAWNYRTKLGKNIIEKATELSDGEWKFRSLTKAVFQRIASGQIQFWGYRKSLYDGDWLTPDERRVESSSLTIKTARDIRALLLIERFDAFDETFFKHAQHFLRTLPPKTAPELAEKEAVKRSDRKPSRRITVIVDTLGKELIFRAKQVKRVILRYTGTLPKGFSGMMLLDKMPDEKLFNFLETTHSISGIVVTDVVLRYALINRGFQKLILLYPLALPAEQSPTLYATRSPLFFVDFTTESRKNYRWPSLRMRTVRSAAGEKIEQFRFLQRRGKVNEIWVDISGSDDEAARRMKSLVDNL